jgi:hypothetical protein
MELKNKNINMLAEVAKQLEGVKWWLMYGTLLDAVRGNANDEDIDIGMYFEDVHKVKHFGNGIAKKFDDTPVYWNYSKDPIINVQAWKKIGDKRYYCEDGLMQQELPSYVHCTSIQYLGVECWIPSDYETLLADWFSNWKVPMDEKARTRIYEIKQTKFENPWKSN